MLSDGEWRAVDDYYSVTAFFVQMRETVDASANLEDREQEYLKKSQPKCSEAKDVISKYAEQ